MDKDQFDFPSSLLGVGAVANEHWTPKKWAVIGASGFIGSAISEQLDKCGIEVIKVVAPRVLLDSSMRQVEDISSLARSLSGMNDLAASLVQCDVVINAAGLATPDGGADDMLFGANSLLPAILLEVANKARVGRFIHLSSAAVQGNKKTLDESTEYLPFSAYSKSKVLGELALLTNKNYLDNSPDVILIRATSVQGEGRQTTRNLRRISASIFASVAAPGNQPTVVSSLSGLVEFVIKVGSEKRELNPILLQPWEKITVREVIEAAGRKSPVVLPRCICQLAINFGYLVCRFLPNLSGVIRRVELMWFGQAQSSPQFEDFFPDSSMVVKALRGEER